MKLRAVWFGLLVFLAACSSTGGPRNANRDPDKAPIAPMAGRVGVMNLLDNDISYVHSGTMPWSGSEKKFDVQFDYSGFVLEELRKGLLTQTPYQPVMVASTGLLRKLSTTWQNTWDGERFSPEIQREFDGIIQSNQLVMLIVVSYSEMSDGVLGSSQKLTGAGLYARSFVGSTKTAVFSTLQFYRIVGKPGKLVFPIAPADDRSIGDLPGVKLPDDLDEVPARYMFPVYDPLRNIARNKVRGLLSLPRKVGA